MARLEQRSTTWRVTWRLGGRRDGSSQSLSFIDAGDGMGGNYTLAVAAKTLIESRGHAITRAEAQRAVLGEQTTAVAGVPTLTDWAEVWFAERRRVADLQPDVLDKYRRMFRGRIQPYLGHLRLTEIGRDQVKEWVLWLQQQKTLPRKGQPPRPLSAQTVHRAHALAHQVLAAAVGTWIPVNPAAAQPGARRGGLGLPKTVPFEGMFLEIWELDAILAACSPVMRDIAVVLVRTGLRLGELLVLRVQDVVVDGRRPHIKVRRALKNDGTIGDPKSESSRRDVGIGGTEALPILRRLVAGRRRNDLIFRAPRGGLWSPHNLRRRYWQPAIAEAQRCAEHPPPDPPKPARGPRRKLRVDEVSTCTCPRRLARSPRLHDLRHTHVSALVEAGWQPKHIQVRVGHASFEITMNIYGHLWNHGHGDRLEALERVFLMVDDEAA
jgi:integrase